MQVTDRFNLLPPSICIICEESPSGRVIDTLRNLKTGVASVLNGRKYVCERCVKEMGKLVDLVGNEEFKQAKVDQEFAEAQLARFRGAVVEVAEEVSRFAKAPGSVDEQRKPEVEEVFPPEPEQKGGTTEGVYKASDSDTAAVPSPGVASAAVPVDDRSAAESADEVGDEEKPKPKRRSKKAE
jgi:hypothetical protein